MSAEEKVNLIKEVDLDERKPQGQVYHDTLDMLIGNDGTFLEKINELVRAVNALQLAHAERVAREESCGPGPQ